MPFFALLKIFFVALSTISYFLSRVIFSTAAYLVVLLIQGCKFPREKLQGFLEQLAELIRSCFEYLFELVWEVITTLISTSFDFVKESLVGSGSAMIGAILALVEKSRESFEGMLKEIPEVFEGLSEMVTTMASDLWNNYKDAVEHIKENAN